MAIPSTFDAFVPNDLVKFFEVAKLAPQYISLDDLKSISVPDAEHSASLEYARKIVSPTTFAHSVRCYYFALAILHNNSPSNTPGVRQITFKELNKRIYHTCILHDLGITDSPEGLDHPASGMSFELHGGIMAYDHLHAAAPSLDKEQVGDITQSIMIHTLSLSGGVASAVGMLIRLAATFDLLGYDVMGPNSFNVVDRQTVKEIEKAYPRADLGGEMVGFSTKERENKPNCLTSNASLEVLARLVDFKAIVPE